MANASPARAAYEAYRDKSGGKSLVTGEALPWFDDLKPDIQDAWRVAAQAARQAPSELEVGADGRSVYTLRKTIARGSETITELRFRKVKAKDLRTLPLDGRTFGHVLDVVGKLCGQPSDVIDEISDEDLQEVSSIAGVF